MRSDCLLPALVLFAFIVLIQDATCAQSSESFSRRAIIDGSSDTKPSHLVKYCSFNDDSCGYTFTRDSDDDVYIGRLQTSYYKDTGSYYYKYTGPRRDRTFGTPYYGYYIGIDAYQSGARSRRTIKNRKGHARSPLFEKADHYCLVFFYSMFGSEIEPLVVNTLVGGKEGDPVLTLTKQKDARWREARVDFDSEYTYKGFRLAFNFHLPDKAYNELTQYIQSAIDDVYMYNTTCSNIPSHPYTIYNWPHRDGNYTSYYTFHIEPKKSWKDAYTFCREQGPSSYLVSIESEEEQKYLAYSIKHNRVFHEAGKPRGFYTSGSDMNNKGSFYWTSHPTWDKVSYSNWKQGFYIGSDNIRHTKPEQPNNVGGNQDCLVLRYWQDDYSWGDEECGHKLPFICEVVTRNKGTDLG